MLHYGVISANDTIEFTFKGNVFQAKLLDGGLVGDCKLKRIHDRQPSDILKNVTAFSSLTAWTEACLQDILEEYYTRYSSWKRVTHCESKRSMGELRDQCKLLDKKKKTEDVSELYKEIKRTHTIIREMTKFMKQKGIDLPPHKSWKIYDIKPSKIECDDVRDPIPTCDPKVSERIQLVMCKKRKVKELSNYF